MRASMKIVPALGLAASALALSALPAGAAATGAAKFTAPVAFSGAQVATLPNSNLKAGATAGTVVYHPSKLSAGWSSTTNPGDCPSNEVMATITNKSGKAQEILYKGQDFGTLPKKAVGGVCFFGSGTATFKFGIKGQTSKLTVTVS